jgi:transcription elongation factor Elf1
MIYIKRLLGKPLKEIVCPYCKSKDIDNCTFLIVKKARDESVLLACGRCNGYFGYYT